MAGLFSKLSELLFGSPERVSNISSLTGQQQNLHNMLLQALMGQGAGGAFGQAADYYRDLLDPSGQAAEAFAAPEMRRFQEEILPQLAERFAGMGSGGALSSSGFRNAAIREGSSLSERLAAMRAGLQQQGAQGLSGLGQMGLSPTMQPVIRQATPGILGSALTGAGQGIGQGLAFGMGGPAGYISSLFNNVKQEGGI